MRSQEDQFDSLVTEKVLDSQVSEILVEISKEICADEMAQFDQASQHLKKKDIAFWLDNES